MSVLIVGAGAAGGYIGERLIAADRDVTFLVHPHTLTRLIADGLRLRYGDEIRSAAVNAVTAADLGVGYDVIVVAVRRGAVPAAIEDVRGAVGAASRIVPVMNGIGHLSTLSTAFGQERVLGASTRLVASLTADGTINVVSPGIEMEIGQLDGAESDALRRAAEELSVDDLAVTVRSDILPAMWEKFAMIAATAVLTCLMDSEIGPIARANGGTALARNVLDEVSAVAAADGYPLTKTFLDGLAAMMTDPSSSFGPSMFRDMRAGRPIEIDVLADLFDRARSHRIGTPLLGAAMVAIDLHNRRIS